MSISSIPPTSMESDRTEGKSADPRALYDMCQPSLADLTDREREFLQSVNQRLTTQRPLTPPMTKWLTDIADRLNPLRDDPDSYVAVTSGMRGYFAVLVQRDPEDGHHYPYNTGIGSYRDAAGAAREAKEWAEAEGIPFVPPKPAADDVKAERAAKAAAAIPTAAKTATARP